MSRRLVAILLIITVISSNLTRCFIFASFQLNRKYIAEKLCENRAKPIMNCKGKCYLKKQLAEEKKKQQESQSPKNSFQEAFLAKTSQIKFHTTLLAVIQLPPDQVYLFQNPSGIFRPPIV